MSSLSEAISSMQIAAASCDQVVGALANAENELSNVEQYIRAGLDGTTQITTVGQYHQAASGDISTAIAAVRQLKEQLDGLVAQFLAGG